jgi:hypothetical protein
VSIGVLLHEVEIKVEIKVESEEGRGRGRGRGRAILFECADRSCELPPQSGELLHIEHLL